MSTTCVHCGQSNYIRKGYRKTQHRGKIQKYLCKSCDKYFTEDKGFYRMRHNPKAITKAIDLYFSNLSSRKVRNVYQRHEDSDMSHVTVLDWCRKYVLKIQKYIDTLQPQLEGNCYADETFIPCGGEKHRFWVCIDYGTRYINAIHYSTQGNVREAIAFLKKAGKKLPKYIQTDAAQFYPQAMRKLYWTNKLQGLKVEHRINNVQKTRKHNVRIETVFSKIKDRVDDMRGLKALWSAPILLAGIILQHNYIEAHTTTGHVPCKMAKIAQEIGVNRWRSLIHLASSLPRLYL